MVTSRAFTHYIGEKFGGGAIFHVWKDDQGGEHGLIADKVDMSTEQVWSKLDKTLVGPPAQSSSDGLNNSKAIVAQEGHTQSAAALCPNSSNGGQNYWYLPSIDELTLLWNNRIAVNKTLSKMRGAKKLDFLSAFYRSSSESEYGNAWYFSFVHGFSDYANTKDSPYFACAIRAFWNLSISCIIFKESKSFALTRVKSDLEKNTTCFF